MIHSKCVCQHNTYGHNCQKCLPLYNNKQWKPAEYGEANECELCECNDHAESCIFDEKLFIANGGRDGGVCACMHNTEGVNCEKCIKNYYHDKSLPFKHPKACKRKICYARYSNIRILYIVSIKLYILSKRANATQLERLQLQMTRFVWIKTANANFM
jgi:hypothetical protein